MRTVLENAADNVMFKVTKAMFDQRLTIRPTIHNKQTKNTSTLKSMALDCDQVI